jgi:peptidyl-tRNA hydrolase, PTH1 family
VILVVGLGNPGSRYAGTRHNVGALVVERLVDGAGGGPWRSRFRGRLAPIEIESERGFALLPETYMNESGQSVAPCAAYYGLPLERILVAHDELDVPFGAVRLKRGGGEAGHRGLESVSACLGSPDYVRLRIGIGRPPPEFPGDMRDFVLQGFPLSDRAALDEVLTRAERAITLFVNRGLSAAMNEVNRKSQ